MGFNEGVHFLIQNGADVNIQCGFRNITPLMAAVTKGRVTYAKALLDAGANVNSVNAEGFTALMCIDASNSSAGDYIECAKLLLRSRAKINIFNRDSRNALQH